VASGSSVEMVYIPEAGRALLCVSSQAAVFSIATFCGNGLARILTATSTVAEVIGNCGGLIKN